MNYLTSLFRSLSSVSTRNIVLVNFQHPAFSRKNAIKRLLRLRKQIEQTSPGYNPRYTLFDAVCFEDLEIAQAISSILCMDDDCPQLCVKEKKLRSGPSVELLKTYRRFLVGNSRTANIRLLVVARKIHIQAFSMGFLLHLKSFKESEMSIVDFNSDKKAIALRIFLDNKRVIEAEPIR